MKKFGIDGFTLTTVTRQSDRAVVQSKGNKKTATLTGIRFQYIPEFAGTINDPNLARILDDKVDAFTDVMQLMRKEDGVTYADVVYYDTTVFVNRANPDTNWIIGGKSYDEIGTNQRQSNIETRQGSGNSPGSQQTDNGG